MGSTPRQASQGWSLERLVKTMLIAVVLATIGLAAFYLNDRYRHENVSLAEREVQRLEDTVRRDPGNTAARVALADSYLAKKMYDQAITQYGEALKLVENQQAALLGLGLAYLGKGDTAKMVEYFDRLVDLNKDKDSAAVDRRLQLIYYHTGRVYLQQEQYDLAIDRLERAIAIDPVDADSLYLLGNAFQAKGEHGDAVDAYRAAVAFVPDFVDAYQGMAKSLEAQGKTANAAYPNAMIAFFSGDNARALQLLESAATQVTDDAELFWALGYVREKAGQKDRAAEAYRQALTVNPNHPLAKESLARVQPASQ